MRKELIIILIIILSVISFFSSNLRLSRNINLKHTLSINGNKFLIDIADIDILRTKGLSGRISMSRNEGMLFIFSEYGIYSFWMKEMNFPLDFVWVRDETVVDITQNVPKPAIEDGNTQNLPLYSPKIPINKVLEINSGMVKETNIKIGDKIIIE
jgi:uncharacterized membrane protein (UPF0127 family)